MTENERLLSLITDKIRKTENAYMLTHTNFLSLSERSLATSCCKEHGATFVFWGGYPEGATYAILLMNILSPYIEKWTAPHALGGKKA